MEKSASGLGTQSIQDLSEIERLAEEKQEENELFKIFLKAQDSGQVDERVNRLNGEVSAEVDCMQCGNCCRSLMINVAAGEPERLSVHFNIPLAAFMEKYIENSREGQMIVNTIPCHFLTGNTCSIYEQRFVECSEFPHLHKPGFNRRLFASFMHYGRCPIVFNVIERLKKELTRVSEVASSV